jgi:hypothetical protein
MVRNEIFYSTISVGKPRKRWEDFFRRDISQVLGIRGWRIPVESTEEWRCLLKEDRAQKGL